MRVCLFCKKEFIARTTVTKYCSHKCNQKHYKARVKEGKIETSNKQTIKVIEQPISDIQAKDILTISEACKILSISRTSLWRLTNNGTLKTAKLGKRVLIRKCDLEKLVL